MARSGADAFTVYSSRLIWVKPAGACAVCFGDPDSAMAQGAVMGVAVLVGVVAFVLLGVAGTGLFWIQRSRRLAQVEDADAPQE